MLASARSNASCTRSSARSTLPHSEMANARRPGTAARISWRTDSSMRILFALIIQAVQQFGEPGRHALTHDFVVHRPKLLAELGTCATVKPAGFCGLFDV